MNGNFIENVLRCRTFSTDAMHSHCNSHDNDQEFQIGLGAIFFFSSFLLCKSKFAITYSENFFFSTLSSLLTFRQFLVKIKCEEIAKIAIFNLRQPQMLSQVIAEKVWPSSIRFDACNPKIVIKNRSNEKHIFHSCDASVARKIRTLAKDTQTHRGKER